MERREALRKYFLEVVRELMARGIVRRRSGQTLEQVLAAEGPRVVAALREDLAAIGLEMGAGLVQAGMRAIGEFLSGGRNGSGR